MPIVANVTTHLEIIDAGKAIVSLKVLYDGKSHTIDLHINGGINDY